MAMTTRYENYEFLVMPFGLTSATATFNTFMNDVFRSLLDRCGVMYLDDIVNDCNFDRTIPINEIKCLNGLLALNI